MDAVASYRVTISVLDDDGWMQLSVELEDFASAKRVLDEALRSDAAAPALAELTVDGVPRVFGSSFRPEVLYTTTRQGLAS